jgi:predicted lipid-binding transport protein (Tim44 family)
VTWLHGPKRGAVTWLRGARRGAVTWLRGARRGAVTWLLGAVTRLRGARRGAVTWLRGAVTRLRGARRGAVTWLLGVVVIGVLSVAADARPGGGQTYSGDSHSYSGGSHSYSGGSHSYSGGSHSYSGGSHSYSGGSYSSSGGGGGGASFSPGAAMGILLGLGITIAIIWLVASVGNQHSYTTTPTAPTPLPPLDLSPVLAHDRDFSRVAFEDFAYQLYAAAQRARHDPGELTKLTPYLGPAALDVLARRAGRVEQVVIGNLRIVAVHSNGDPHMDRLVVAVEANLAAPTGTTNVAERWTFARSPKARTRPPERTRTLACPSCNAPFSAGADPRTCAHCGEAIEVGRFDWTVSAIQVDAETSVGYTLTGTVEEIGNDFPTLAEPAAHERLMELRKDDAHVTWDAFTARVRMIYDRLGAAWNAQDLIPVRGLVTSSLLQYLQFWIDAYRRQGLANKLEDAKIRHIALAKVTRDPWFDAITVRVYADGLDYTLDQGGHVVGGSRGKRRAYTEYWTLLRSSARRGPITTEPRCPNCGAPLAVSDAGACTHCSAVIENASLDWTLSKIEQDDVYRG